MSPSSLDLLPLHSPLCLERDRVGGKAVGLARLVQRGLPVPEGFVVPAGVFRAFLDRSHLMDAARACVRAPETAAVEDLQARIGAAPLPAELLAQLQREGPRVGFPLVVRSSAADEDARTASFAGMYGTLLSIRTLDSLVDAIRSCWRSAFSPRVLAYRKRLAIPGEPTMAVLVQRMVEARAAGVLFTVNPMNGSWREMTVEAAWGLGEAVVSGQVVPDHYVVRRPRRKPGETVTRLAARIRLEVLQETRNPQDRQLLPGPSGVDWRPVPGDRVNAPKLAPATLLQLCRLALRIEAMHGRPQDVEWAEDASGRLFLLQARPITTSAAPNRDARVLWTRRFIGERWIEPATPLGWSLIRPILEWFIAYPETNQRFLGGGEALRLVDGAPYINATVFRHLAFKLPGMPPPRFMMDMLPPQEERTWYSRFGDAPGFQVYASILKETFDERRWRRFRWNPLTNHSAWDVFEKKLEDQVPPLLDPPPRGAAQALARAEAGMDLARDYVKIHVTSLLFANILYQVSDGLIRLWVQPDGASVARDALRCPARNLTVQTNHDLWRLARVARDQGADLNAVPPPDTPFSRAFHDFLARHGHRSDATWEIMSPRWVEQPERVLAMLRHHRDPAEKDPAEMALEQSEAAAAAIARMTDGLEDPFRRFFLPRLVELTRKYLLLRENQRYHFDRLLFAVKRAWLVIGECWVQEGWLDRADDIRFLEAAEVAAVVRGQASGAEVRPRVQARSSTWHHQKTLSPPDFLSDEETGATQSADPEVSPTHRMEGLGASPGVARGRVRVLHDLAESDRLCSGEILVTRSTDPGWTPLFLVARGVILELGSQLSHGAVVAREYRLPTVVNVRNATRLLKDGQEVTVDGGRGIVWVHG